MLHLCLLLVVQVQLQLHLQKVHRPLFLLEPLVKVLLLLLTIPHLSYPEAYRYLLLALGRFGEQGKVWRLPSWDLVPFR